MRWGGGALNKSGQAAWGRGLLETGAELGMNRQGRERERQLGPRELLHKGQGETQPGQVKSSDLSVERG